MRIVHVKATDRYYTVEDHHLRGQKRHDVTDDIKRIVSFALNDFVLRQTKELEEEMDADDRLLHPTRDKE